METDLVEGLKCFIDAIVNENVSLVISRSLLSEVASSLQQIQDGIAKAVAHYTLDAVQPRVISFEDQVGAIRQHLAGKGSLLPPFRRSYHIIFSHPVLKETCTLILALNSNSYPCFKRNLKAPSRPNKEASFG